MGAVESRVSLLCWPSTAARYVLTEDRGVASNDVQHAIHLARCSRDGPLHSRRKNSNLWYSDWHGRLRRKSVSSLLCFKFGGKTKIEKWNWYGNREKRSSIFHEIESWFFYRRDSTHYGRYTIIIINTTIYLQFSYMQLIKFILYICNVYYRILFLNSVKGNSKDTFHIFVDIFSG